MPTNDNVALMRRFCGQIANQSGDLAPVIDAMTQIFVGSRLVDFPYLFNPDDAEPFDFEGEIPLPAFPSGPTTVLSFKNPTGYNGVINRITHLITQPFNEGSGQLIWALLEGQKPIKNFGNMTASRGNLVSPYPVDHILIHPDQTIKYTINNVSLAGGGIVAICRVGGYYYPTGRVR